MIDRCRRLGLEPIQAPAPRGALAGKTLVFTGGLQAMTREEAEERARALGARTASSVSRDTDLVVAGADPGTKYVKARALGIRVIDERQFKKLIGPRA